MTEVIIDWEERINRYRIAKRPWAIEALTRDNFTCQKCKKQNVNIVVHYLDKDRTNTNLNNLLSICKPCLYKSVRNQNLGRDSHIVTLRKAGMPIKQIAERYGISTQRVSEILIYSGEPDLPRRMPPEKRQKKCLRCGNLFFKKNQSNKQWYASKYCGRACPLKKSNELRTHKINVYK